jgi:hypothetical protein
MPSSPIAPRLNVPPLKGAIVTIDATTQQPLAVTFQYNPETLRRSLKPNTVGGDEGDRSSAVRYTGAPVETISVEVQVDATDQLNVNDPTAMAMGIAPQLAALELLLYPPSSQIVQSQASLASGAIELVPILAPQTLFVWGANRVVPVRLTAISVSEELFGANLNPIRANVSLEMRVLSYSDVYPSNPDYQAFLSYQQLLERIAPLAEVTNPATMQAQTGYTGSSGSGS